MHLWVLALGCNGSHPTPTLGANGPLTDAEADAAPEGNADNTPSIEAAAAYNAALQLEEGGRMVEALAAAQRAIKGAPTRDAHMLGARLAIGAERYEIAAEWTDAVIAKHPEDADAYYNRGLIAHRRNKYNAARTSYLSALRHRPTNADARFNLVLLTWNSGAKEEARHHAERFFESHPSDPRVKKLSRLVSRTAHQ